MIVYKVTDGEATDLRYEADDYRVAQDERSLAGFGRFPDMDTLHDREYVQLRTFSRVLRLRRAAALRALDDARLEQAMTDPNSPTEVQDYAAVKA